MSDEQNALARLRGRRSSGRFGRETVGIAVLVVIALICAGLIAAVVVKTRHDAAVAAREAAAYTPPALARASPTATGPSVSIIGDAGVDEVDDSVSTADRWPALLAKDLHGSVAPLASAGTGYASAGSRGRTFVDEASAVPTSADVVVFFGGVADADASASTTARAAVDAFAAAARRVPCATVVAVGPVHRGGASSASVAALRTTLSKAKASLVTWVDPIAAGWLSDSREGASSAASLTAGDERTIATKVAAAISSATD